MYSEGANRSITINYLYFVMPFLARYYPDAYSLQTVDLSHCENCARIMLELCQNCARIIPDLC